MPISIAGTLFHLWRWFYKNTYRDESASIGRRVEFWWLLSGHVPCLPHGIRRALRRYAATPRRLMIRPVLYRTAFFRVAVTLLLYWPQFRHRAVVSLPGRKVYLVTDLPRTALIKRPDYAFRFERDNYYLFSSLRFHIGNELNTGAGLFHWYYYLGCLSFFIFLIMNIKTA